MEIIIAAAFILVLLGLLIPSPFSWASRRRVEKENRAFREHLHTQMEIDAEGYKQVLKKVDQLTQMNANLRTTIETLKNKPGRAELRLLHTYDRAVNIMLERAPGFAPTWQRVLAHVEKENQRTDVGLAAFVKKIFRPSALLGYDKGASHDGHTIDAVAGKHHDTTR